MTEQDNVTTLVIQIMPLLMREFKFKLDSFKMVSDPDYAQSIFHLTRSSGNERLRDYAERLRHRLVEIENGYEGVAHSQPLRKSRHQPEFETAGPDHLKGRVIDIDISR
jgi:hypothetical protein